MRLALLAGVALALATGCGAAANEQYLDRENGVGGTPTTANIADVPVHGAQVYVEQSDGSETEGELLAADAKGVTVLEPADDISHVDARNIQSVEVILYHSGSSVTAAWTVFGTLSSLSHGMWAIFSMPVWILTGTIASANARSDSKLAVDRFELDALHQFARFPQGLPPGFIARFDASQQHKAEWLSSGPPVDSSE